MGKQPLIIINMYNTCTLENGLRVIHRYSAGDVIYCGYAIKAGSRDELPGEEGLAHFCEHASFKGTESRKARHLIQALEVFGGELNAYTNKESTVYYCAIQRKHMSKAVDVLSDMVFHSVYPGMELVREKEVICDEIESYNDSPAELIYDDFENIIFKNHPLGHNILGTSENVRSFKSADAKRFVEKYYRPDNAIFFLHGDVDFKRLKRALEKYSPKTIPQQTIVQPAPSVLPDMEETPQVIKIEKDTHQAHVLLGCRAYGINHPLRLALYILNNMLAGPAMSSSLNMTLREKNGLVYTVESSMTCYGDTGLWSVYFGCDSRDVPFCLKLIRRELDRFMNKPLTKHRLDGAKRQLKGQISLACDSRESFALDFAKSFLHYGWEKDVTALYASIDKVTSEDVLQVARELFAPEALHTLMYV